MGKHLRYVILSFSVVLAIFLFALIWQVRPAEGSGLESAENRQAQGMSAVFGLSELSDANKEELKDYLLSDEAFIDSLATALSSKVGDASASASVAKR